MPSKQKKGKNQFASRLIGLQPVGTTPWRECWSSGMMNHWWINSIHIGHIIIMVG